MNVSNLEEILVNMEELIRRVATVVITHLPSSSSAMNDVFSEWNKIISELYREAGNESGSSK